VNYSIVRLSGSELTGGARRIEKANPRIFVAHRFSARESREFREKLAYEVNKSEKLSDVEIVDGHVLPGKKWATEIRGLISKSRLVVADVTSLSPEVLFECGFAWGLSRPILPVVQDEKWVSRLPRWLTDLQIGNFTTESGWKDLIDSIAENLIRGRARRHRLPEPIPGKTVWLRGSSHFEEHRVKFDHIAGRFNLAVSKDESLPDDLGEADESLINEVCRCSLLVASLNNTAADSFVHFAAGVVAAHPSAGVAKRKLNRMVVMAMVSRINTEEILAADGARRTAGVVSVVGLDELETELLRFGRLYTNWLTSQEDEGLIP